MTNKNFSFSPVVSNDPKILILGTMPGKVSLNLQEYYGNKRNSFWKIIFENLKIEDSLDSPYEEKLQILKNNQICLWDVCNCCFRKSSLDKDIKEETPNEIPKFLTDHPTIDIVVFNGQKSANLYKKHHKLIDNVKYFTMPSTSPANTTFTYEQKFNEWKKIFNQFKRKPEEYEEKKENDIKKQKK